LRERSLVDQTQDEVDVIRHDDRNVNERAPAMLEESVP
jgi:hypothetical protein